MRRLVTFMALACAVVLARPAAGQDGPRFLLAGPSKLVPLDVSRTPILARRLTLDLENVTLREALAAIAAQSGLELAYDDEVVPLERRVDLRADAITVAAALTDVLFGTNVDVAFDRGGTASLLRRTDHGVAPPGAVIGQVTDVKTGEGIVGADVALEGTRHRATTGEDGRYRLGGVAAGSYTLAVRRIGYRRQTRAVTVNDGQQVTVDVALEAIPTQLDEVVTTVTGEQRLRELGHVVGRINADSLVKEAPISSVTELLSARVPGLLVQQASGTVGGEVTLRIRSASSAVLSRDPIIIVDGIRYQSNPQIGTGADLSPDRIGPFGNEGTSRLNDLNPNDIESVEVVKGPSAATLYGTDAANGVIVITTKRGRPGPARWNTYGRATTSTVPQYTYPDIWWGWSSQFGLQFPCTLEFVARGFCTQDSVTVSVNPLNSSTMTIFASKPQWEYGLNVSGGHPDLRYYVSGDFERKTGPIQLPPGLVDAIKEQRGVAELPEELRKPNTSSRNSFHANLAAAAGSRANVQVNAGYTQNAARTLVANNPYVGAFEGNPESPYHSALSPVDAFSQRSTERVGRFTGSVAAEVRPAGWLRLKANVGLDHANSLRESIAQTGEAPNARPNGLADDTRTRYVATSADFGGTVSLQRGRISSRTAVGAQYVRSFQDLLSVTGDGLPVGRVSVSSAAFIYTFEQQFERVTLGSYIEQTFGLNDRLYINGALRFDGATGFGQEYDVAMYPKAGASWLLSEEPFFPQLGAIDEVRLRYAFGASGRQAWPVLSRPRYGGGTALIDGVVGPSASQFQIGNPDLRPERVREHEIGVDAQGLHGRVGLSLTWNWRRTNDGIQTIQLPAGLGSHNVNVGLIAGHGFELELTGQLLRSRFLTVDLALHHSWQDSKLLDLGDVQTSRFFVTAGVVEGYPLGSRFARPLEAFADVNGDGIIRFSELQIGADPIYVGRGTPPRSQIASLTVGAFEQRVRVSALLERQSGFVQINERRWRHCGAPRCRELIDPTTPLEAQARAYSLGQGTTDAFQSGAFTRLREVSVAVDVPSALVRAFGLRNASLALAGRNLALWTDYSGDPESRDGDGNIPQARTWVVRADLGF